MLRTLALSRRIKINWMMLRIVGNTKLEIAIQNRAFKVETYRSNVSMRQTNTYLMMETFLHFGCHGGHDKQIMQTHSCSLVNASINSTYKLSATWSVSSILANGVPQAFNATTFPWNLPASLMSLFKKMKKLTSRATLNKTGRAYTMYSVRRGVDLNG